jgi:2-polyprenyl-3-methyl-5-hydroxy-6-metoxy-1,4-benzoquinol methylase
MDAIRFDKYDNHGAYHWKECRRSLFRYKAFNPALVARYRMVINEASRLPRNGRLLDVGCGDGYLLGQLAPFVIEGVGIDSEPEAIRIATTMLADQPHCRVMHNACYQIPFEDAAFDVVTSTDVIEHLTDPDGHLSEIRRVLRPGGTLLLTTPKWRPDRKWDERHVKEFTADELRVIASKYFARVRLVCFWPAWCSRLYSTAIGWRLLKLAGIAGLNPFLRHSDTKVEGYGQLLAVCSSPLP